MSIEKGAFLLVDYTGKVKETGEVFDTTIEELAKKERLYKEGDIYEPRLIIVGEGWVLKALDESFQNFEVDKAASIEIPSDKAFGSRDPEKVRMVPLRRLTARGITPQLGMRLEFDGKLAIVRTLGSGRVQLDFNPPLAGKTLVYEVTVKKKLEAKDEKISTLVHRRIPTVEIEKFGIKIGKNLATISVPEEAFLIEGIQLAKRGVATDIQKFFPEMITVRFVEEFKRKEGAAEQKPPQKTTP
jgi:FKBP-type peptidyl-prolyl cis-trans isomerase 2